MDANRWKALWQEVVWDDWGARSLGLWYVHWWLLFHFSGLLALVALTDFVIYIYCQTLPITLCVLWHALHWKPSIESFLLTCSENYVCHSHHMQIFAAPTNILAWCWCTDAGFSKKEYWMSTLTYCRLILLAYLFIVTERKVLDYSCYLQV